MILLRLIPQQTKLLTLVNLNGIPIAIENITDDTVNEEEDYEDEDDEELERYYQ